MSDPVNAETVHLIMSNEGCRLQAYQDPVGIWTIGYGHTGDEVYAGLVIDQAKAEALLEKDLATFENGVDDALDPNADTSDNQYGAMVSLAFNIGLGHFKSSTVIDAHNAGDKAKAADAFLMWNRAGGRVLDGLTRRREEERALYLKPDADAPLAALGNAPHDKPGLIAYIAKLLRVI